jgi:hypothetical protein
MGWLGDLFGGGDDDPTTSVDIPEWLRQYIEPLLRNTTDLYGDWQSGGAGAMMPGWEPPPDPDAKQEGPREADPGRYNDAMQWYNMDPDRGWSQWTEEGTGAGGFEAPEEGFWGDASQYVYGPSPWEEMAASKATEVGNASGWYDLGIGQLDRLDDPNWQEQEMGRLSSDWGTAMGEEQKAIELGSQMWNQAAGGVPVEGIESDPRYQAQMKAYEEAVAPMLANMGAQAGLSRSGAMGAAQARGMIESLVPTVNDVLGARERDLERRMGVQREQAGRYMDIGGRKRGAKSERLGVLGDVGSRLRGGVEKMGQARLALGDREQQRKLDAISNLMAVGGNMRDIRQSQSDADYNEWLRKAAAFESSFSPLGIIPSTFGSRQSGDKKDK